MMLCLCMALSLAGCGLAATQAPDSGNDSDSSSSSDSGNSGDAASGTVGAYGSSAETQGKTNEIVIKVSNGAGETSPGVKAQLTTFAPMVENDSKGRVGVEVYSGGQLGDDTTATEMVVAGQLEINNTSTAPLVGYVPELGIFDIPFLFNDEAEADAIMASEVGDYLNAKLETKGIVNLAWNENGFRELTNSKRRRNSHVLQRALHRPGAGHRGRRGEPHRQPVLLSVPGGSGLHHHVQPHLQPLPVRYVQGHLGHL